MLVKDANTNELNEIISSYSEEFQDKETRHIYVDEFLNAKIATQIKVLREQKGWTQEQLAEEAKMKQERISILEDVNYSAWTLSVLRRFAEAFDLRLNVSFEEFGSFLEEFVNFDRTSLERKSFEDDSVFNPKAVLESFDEFAEKVEKEAKKENESNEQRDELPSSSNVRTSPYFALQPVIQQSSSTFTLPFMPVLTATIDKLDTQNANNEVEFSEQPKNNATKLYKTAGALS